MNPWKIISIITKAPKVLHYVDELASQCLLIICFVLNEPDDESNDPTIHKHSLTLLFPFLETAPLWPTKPRISPTMASAAAVAVAAMAGNRTGSGGRSARSSFSRASTDSWRDCTKSRLSTSPSSNSRSWTKQRSEVSRAFGLTNRKF